MGGLFGVPNGSMGLDHLVTTIIQVGCNPPPAPWKPWLPRAAWGRGSTQNKRGRRVAPIQVNGVFPQVRAV